MWVAPVPAVEARMNTTCVGSVVPSAGNVEKPGTTKVCWSRMQLSPHCKAKAEDRTHFKVTCANIL